MAIKTRTNKIALDTSQKKFGNSSIAFNGTDNYLKLVAESSEFLFETNPFTVEGWVRFNSVDTLQTIVTNRASGYATGDWYLQLNDTGNLEFGVYNETPVVGSTTILADTWYHFAIERTIADSATMYVLLNGVSECGIGSMPTDTSFGESDNNELYFGSFGDSNVLDGYIDEIRVSDIGRYTSLPTTPPSTPFTTDSNTLKIVDFEDINDIKTTTTLNIDWSLLNINFLPSTTYRIALEEGFTKSLDASRSLSQAVDNYGTFTTNAADSQFVSSDPADSSTNVVNNTYIDATFDRYVKAGNVTANLYSVVGAVDTLVHSYDTGNTSQVTYSGNVATFNTLGYITSDTTYRLDILANSIIDIDGFAVSNLPQSIEYVTGNATVFPKFESDITVTTSVTTDPRVILYADRFLTLPVDSTVNYTEDTITAVTGTPTVADYTTDGTGTYTLTITPSTTSYVDTLASTGSASSSFNDTSKVLTISGTRDAVNSNLANLTILTENDVTSTFTLTYEVTTPSSDTKSQTQSLQAGNVDSEVSSNISDARSYTANNSTLIFATNTPQITDYDTDPDDYQIQLTSPIGAFSSLSDDSDYATTWTYSGTKAQINAKMADIKFWPTAGTSSNSTFTYVQRKDGVQQVSVTPTLNGSAGTFTATVRTLTNGQSYIPSVGEQLYASNLDVLVVGAGGGGTYGGGGGGGGYVTESLNNDISTIDLSTKYFYAVVGTGGAAGASIDQASSWTEHGSDGGSSSVEIYESGFASGDGSWTAAGGQGGRNYYGGFGTFSTNFDGGQSAWGGGAGFGQPQNTNQWAGGGGAGADQAGYSASAETGGAGGRGVQSSITGTATYYGGGGAGGSYDTVAAGGQGGGGDGGDLLNTEATAGTNGLGGGGGAGYHSQAVGTVVGEAGKSGGSGTVIIKFKA